MVRQPNHAATPLTTRRSEPSRVGISIEMLTESFMLYLLNKQVNLHFAYTLLVQLTHDTLWGMCILKYNLHSSLAHKIHQVLHPLGVMLNMFSTHTYKIRLRMLF